MITSSVNEELSLAREDMLSQDVLYRPTTFWDAASSEIVRELNQYGMSCFRRLSTPLGFFVPTYGLPGNSFSAAQAGGLQDWLAVEHPHAQKPSLSLQQFLNGEAAALADYRVFLAADNPSRQPNLRNFTETNAGGPVEQFEFHSRKFSRSSLNYLLGLSMLKRHLDETETVGTVLEIGGGFGSLGEILFSAGIQNLRYIDIDIPPTSFVAQWYLQQVAGLDSVTTYTETRNLHRLDISALKPLSTLNAWQIEKLHGQVDLFVNFISFQEMEPPVVKNYLSHVSRLKARWVLLRNMREGKQKRTAGHLAGVETPIKGDDYAEMLPGYTLIERNVHPFGYQTIDGFHSELFLFRKE